MDTPDTLTPDQQATFVHRWLTNPYTRCGFCGGHTTECASAAALSVGRRLAIPCGA